jgi:hypothetical protein
MMLRFLIPMLICLSVTAMAAETEIAIPRTAPDDPMQSFLRVANGNNEDAVVEGFARDGAGLELARWTWRVRGHETVTRLLKAELPPEAFRRLATVTLVHPGAVTVQHVVGKAPPDRPGAFSVPA